MDCQQQQQKNEEVREEVVEYDVPNAVPLKTMLNGAGVAGNANGGGSGGDHTVFGTTNGSDLNVS